MSELPAAFDFDKPFQSPAHSPLTVPVASPGLPPIPTQAEIQEQQELSRQMRQRAMQEPGVVEFIRSVKYQQHAELIPGMKRPDGTFILTLEEVQEWYAKVEPDLDKAFGVKVSKQKCDWEQRQELWSQQRAQREADKAAREAERERRRNERAAFEAEVNEARRLWKEAVARREDLLVQINAEIKELHDAFTEKKQRLDQL